jgi:hypothetical protein
MSGIALLVDKSSIISQSQSIFDTLQIADFFISTSPLYVDIPPDLLIDFETIFDEVFFPICITFAQVSWFCPTFANATHK